MPDRIRKSEILKWFFWGLGVFLIAILLRIFFSAGNRPEEVTRNFNRILHKKENITYGAFGQLQKDNFRRPTKEQERNQSVLARLCGKNDIYLFVYQNDSLVYWSSNSVAPPPLPGLKQSRSTKFAEKEKSGWYETISIQDYSGRVFAGKILLKHQYPFENEYLRNDFAGEFSVPAGTSPDLHPGRNQVLTSDGKFLISLKIPVRLDLQQWQIFILFLLYLLGFLLILVTLYKIYLRLKYYFPSKLIFILFFAGDVIILRVILSWLQFPAILYDSALFGPGPYSSSFFLPSLGDFLVNSLVLLVIAYAFFKHYPATKRIEESRKIVRFSVAGLLLLTEMAWLFGIVYCIRDLVVNSTIPFNLQDISGLNLYSVLGCIIISALFLSYYLFSVRVINTLAILTGRMTNKGSEKNKAGFSLKGIVISLVIFSVAWTVVLNYSNSSAEREKRKLLALKLGTARDAMAELLFSKEEASLFSDTALMKMISDTSLQDQEEMNDSIERYLQTSYFHGYWNNYTFQVTLCPEKKTLRVQPQNYLINCRTYFQNTINEFGKSTLSRYLYFLDYGYGYKNYVAVLPYMGDQDNGPGPVCYIEISSKLIFKDIGYPELLIDKNQGQVPDLYDYSYAYYRSGKLTHRVGTVQYQLELSQAADQLHLPAHYYSRDGYSHYYYPIDYRNILIISKKENTLLDRIAPFSYLFFFLALVFIAFFLVTKFPEGMSMSLMQLRDRLQLSLAGLLLASLVITGGLTIYYITTLNSAKNKENLSERTHSLLIELQHKMGNSPDFREFNNEGLDEMMTEFSNVFFVDVNLYSMSGRLIATSRPEIFGEGLSSELMNREAFVQLTYFHKSYYFQREKIGENGYNSAYIPFFNDRNKLLAFLNLPYFARQDDLKKEISGFLVAFINVYAFLIIVGITLAVVVSNYISRPLRILASRIGMLTYGKQNEKIEWKRRDEIGKLVDEYNRMIDELERSAGLLAKSERETAWREMARQVAHEIKNPLTPMKLSVQHLERAWKDKAGDWDERLKRFTSTMTDQIENLSAIASEFSDFAKMPVALAETVDINDVLKNVRDLYQDSSGIKFVFSFDENTPHLMTGDRKQLLRLFTNLMNNAVQAIGGKPEGHVNTGLQTSGSLHVISVSDNGAGMSPETAERIFHPNFTTKSGGMGLGLPIVKSILEGMSGKIHVVSSPGKGTTFSISFPVYK